jgi:hypothetical protein
MDNLCAGIWASSSQQKKEHRIPWVIRVKGPDYSPHQRVAGFTGIGGSFQMEWVAALPWNRWQDWSGILKLIHTVNGQYIKSGTAVIEGNYHSV